MYKPVLEVYYAQIRPQALFYPASFAVEIALNSTQQLVMRRNLFSADSDMLAVFEHLEKKIQVKYTPAGVFSSPEIASVTSGAALSSLRPESHAYLVTPESVTVRPRLIQLHEGGQRFAFDELINPEAVTLQIGRIAKDGEVLLPGLLGTTATAGPAVALHRAFAAAIEKHFVKVKAYWVGPSALRLLKRGVRLTIGPDAAREFDLTLEEQRGV